MIVAAMMRWRWSWRGHNCLRRIAQHLGKLVLVAAARSSQPSALQLALVAPFQPLAELLGAVAFLCPNGRP